jgi:hypothetical protein
VVYDLSGPPPHNFHSHPEKRGRVSGPTKYLMAEVTAVIIGWLAAGVSTGIAVPQAVHIWRNRHEENAFVGVALGTWVLLTLKRSSLTDVRNPHKSVPRRVSVTDKRPSWRLRGCERVEVPAKRVPLGELVAGLLDTTREWCRYTGEHLEVVQ